MAVNWFNVSASSGWCVLKKKCPKCNKIKSLESFPKNGGRGDGRGAYCKVCQRKLGMADYHKHKERYYQVARERNKKIAELIARLKAGPCKDCGKKYPPYVMDFDHLPGQIKIANVSYLKRHRVAFEKIEAEVKKCDLVCANCHRVRSYKRQHKNPIGGNYKQLGVSRE